MSSNIVQEVLVSLALVFLLVLFLNPFHFWMPTALLMVMTLGLMGVFGVFASLIWRERAHDEREGFHRMFAGRVAFLVGTTMLIAGIVAQSVRHELDPWLVLTLGSMIFAKVLGLMYGHIKH